MMVFQVDDMRCDHCVASITAAVKALDPGAWVQISLDNHRVMVEGTALTGSLLETAIRDAGFSPLLLS